MTGPKPWSDMPELALNAVFLEVGLSFIGDLVCVCKQWWKLTTREGFWKGVVQREFHVMTDVLPGHIKTWQEFAKTLHFQRVFLIGLGPSPPKELRFQDKTGALSNPRGVIHFTVSKLVDCMDGKMTEIYVYMCIMASNELLLWASTDISAPVVVQKAVASYTASFKGKHIVEHVAQDVSGALVSTIHGELHESVAWGRNFDGHFVADFEKVEFPSGAGVLCFKIGCNGVRVVALRNGIVYVWGKVFGLLYEQVGVDPPSMFGLGEESGHVVTVGQMAAVEYPLELTFQDLVRDDQIVEFVAGSAHFLARSKGGDVWVWGFNGCDATGSPIKLASVPTKVVCPKITKLHNAHMMETNEGKLLAYSEFVCGGSNHPVWTPMYNLQYDVVFGPAPSNPWPWEDCELKTVRAHSRDILEMPLPSDRPLPVGCVGYTKHGEGCIRIHVFSDDECKNIREPMRVCPMFDVGSEVLFGRSGNLYYGCDGRVVVKDVSRALMRDQFYLVDLSALGIPSGRSLIMEKPFGGWLLAVVSP